MSYPLDIQKPKNLQDIISRKEFAQLKLNHDYLQELEDAKLANERTGVNESFLTNEIRNSGNLSYLSQQNFVRNWISINTPFTRLLLKHSTGTGKTIGSLAAAIELIKEYRKMSHFTESPGMVMIIGFSKHVFHKELLRHPEFGFISRSEMEDHKKLKHLAETGTQIDKDALTDFEMKIKKRLSNKQIGGFFKFFGYKEFFNRLFIFSEEAPIDKSKLGELDIYKGIKEGWVKLNYDLIRNAANSLMICDEIHNVYNSLDINNYGIALQMMLNLYDSPDTVQKTIPVNPDILDLLRNSNIKAVFMSATPINNSPTEVVDLLNLLVPLSRLPNRQRLKKEDLFSDGRNLKKGSKEAISNLVRGYVSFFRDDNPKYFPQFVDEGKPIKIPPKVRKEDKKSDYSGSTIPYLKFIQCSMSPLHWKTYKAIYEGTLPPDGQSLIDFVLPNPDKDAKLGLFRTREIKHGLSGASRVWKERNQIDIVKQTLGSTGTETEVITGEFMNVKNIGKYSSKYETIIKDLLTNIREDAGKVIIIHQYVKMSGVLFVQEMFRRNGILDEYSNPIDSTLCVTCGKEMKGHSSGKSGSSGKSHTFEPVRSVILHGDIDKTTMDRSIEKFNNSSNLMGHKFKILIGSKMVREAYDFKAVQHLWIISPPTNIPSLIQIRGRPARKNSHIQLPIEMQKVYGRIYVSSVPDGTDLSYEERRYYDKSKDYLVIQELEKILNESGIDATIHRDIIFPPATEAETKKAPAELGTLYFQPAQGVIPTGMPLTTITADVFHSDNEIEQILFIIKRMFIEQSPVWAYDDLWRMVQEPPFEVYVNTHMFSEENFLIALDLLVYSTKNQVNVYTASSLDKIEHEIDRLFDHLDRKIVKKGVECQIIYKNGYYILFPNDNIFNTSSYMATEYKKDLTRMKQTATLGLNVMDIVGYPEIDIDSWARHPEKIERSVFNITKYLKTSNISYNNMKYKFFSRFRKLPVYKLPVSVEVYGLDFHSKLVEDAVRYVFNVLTNPRMSYSELHDFYFKMIYFYDKLDMILFADHLEGTQMFNSYKTYVTKSQLKVPDINYATGKKKIKYEIVKEDNQYNAFLMSSLSKSTGSSAQFNIERINAFIDKSRSSVGFSKSEKDSKASIGDDIKKARSGKKYKTTKVFSNMLPVGHFLAQEGIIGTVIPRVYKPEEDSWGLATEFVEQKEDKKAIENDYLVGYYEKNPTGIDVKFKLRPPAHKIVKHSDSRMIERGSVCSTRKKEELHEIAKHLEIDIKGVSIKELCDLIKFDLMHRELRSRREARKKKSPKRVRWFYLHFENQEV
jgi:African swine fever virus helicase